MFRCQICGKVAPAGTRANKVVVVSRPRTYAARGTEREGFRRRFRAPKKEYDKGGHGTEIVQELTACDRCAEKQVTRVLKPERTEEDKPTAERSGADGPSADETQQSGE